MRKGRAEARETAYKAYAASSGQDMKGLIGRLKEENGISVSATTLYKWKKDGDWEGRAAGEKSTLHYF